uniref:Vitamin K-dependent protein C n=1 Tax=Glossina brevipalpis TaxID=37001 RepID=A0A1A9X3F3_9MUSC
MANFQKIDRKVAQIITHPKYNARTYDNDIAIVKMDKPVEMTELLHPVCMPTPGKSFKGETGIVTGWGALRVGGPTSDTLQEVQVPIMSQDDCRKSRYGPSRITDNMLCAGYEEGQKDSCQGDSGGPLHVVAHGTREHQLVGVVSWGEGCAKAGYPGVYSRVNRYVTTSAPITVERECSQCTCGTRNTIKRIVGGQETEVNQYPWMAMLRFRERFYCGASVINDLYVASAAHCLRGFTPSLLSVRVLEHNRRNSSAQIIDRKVSRVFVHEKYSTRNFNNDIGLVKLDQPITMSDILRPVCMPEKDHGYEHEEAIITGWGAIREGGPVAEALQEVRVPILSLEECRNSSYGSSRITENMLCAGVPEGGKDSCQGDSGGPLHVAMENTDTYHLAGIVSWGEGCARPNLPGVYTRVSSYLEWIEEKTKDGCKCGIPEKKYLEQEKFLEFHWSFQR